MGAAPFLIFQSPDLLIPSYSTVLIILCLESVGLGWRERWQQKLGSCDILFHALLASLMISERSVKEKIYKFLRDHSRRKFSKNLENVQETILTHRFKMRIARPFLTQT